MGTELNTKMKLHSAYIFSGGKDRGVCLQISPLTSEYEESGFISLTMEEAAALSEVLAVFIKDEAIRRQKLLKATIKRHSEMENTVFAEIANLPGELLELQASVINIVSIFCPKHENVKL